MEPDYTIFDSPGFTINMSHYAKNADEIRDGLIISGESWLRLYVDCSYGLGYVFGAFLSKGIANVSNHRGQVKFRRENQEDSTALYEAFEEAFNVAPRFRSLPNSRYEMVVYSKPVAKLLREFGVGVERRIPQKYLVNNRKYLLGILRGIEDLDGLEEDRRDILNRRKHSSHINKIYDLIDSKDLRAV